MFPKLPDKVLEQYEEIRKLYDLSESEIFCLTQMAMIISGLGFGGELTIKLMRALTAYYEVTWDNKKAENKEKK